MYSYKNTLCTYLYVSLFDDINSNLTWLRKLKQNYIKLNPNRRKQV